MSHSEFVREVTPDKGVEVVRLVLGRGKKSKRFRTAMKSLRAGSTKTSRMNMTLGGCRMLWGVSEL